MGWNRSPLRALKDIEGRLHELNKKQARQVLSMVYKLSPVKTGRYKSNHIVSVDRPTDMYDARRRDHARWYAVALETINSSPRGSKLYIQQNLPYGPVIEAGSSTQAPSGVYRVAAMSVKL